MGMLGGREEEEGVLDAEMFDGWVGEVQVQRCG